LVVTFPYDWDGDVMEYQVISSTTLSCSQLSGLSTNSMSCTYTTAPSPINAITVTISALSVAGISSQTAYSISISPVLTPPFTNDNQRVSISSTPGDGTPIDKCSTVVTNTLPIPCLSSFSISNGTSVVQSSFTGNLQMTLGAPFSYQDTVILSVPNNFLTDNKISITSFNYLSFMTTVQFSPNSSSQYTLITLSNFASSPDKVAANSAFTFRLINVTNYIST
jgi:hypothetical protein